MQTFARLTQFRVTQFMLALLCIGVPLVLSNVAVKLFPVGEELTLLRNGFKILVLIAAYLAYTRWVEKRSPSELSLPGSLKELGIGFLLGAALVILSVAVLGAIGAYQADGINVEFTWLRFLTSALAVAILEELIFRAFLFRIVEKHLGTSISILLTAVLFGVAHAANPNATWFSTVSLVATGLILVGAFLLTRRLWLCAGLHWSWNLFQALCSLPVSGTEIKGFLNGKLAGPIWLTGGDFGIEASVPVLVLSIVTASILFYFAYARGRFIAPYWKDKRKIAA